MTVFPSLSPAGERRQARLADSRLAAVAGTRPATGDLGGRLAALCEGSVDLLLLREPTAPEDALRVAADAFRRVCDRYGALFVVDGLPGLAVQVGADGVHVGPVDAPPDHARRVVGPDLLIGRTARRAASVAAAADEDVDYVAVGDGLIEYASGRCPHVWFAPAGADLAAATGALDRGAGRLLAEGLDAVDDPGPVCWALRRALAAHPL
ncbi:MAG: thiamine phosphate synthase [Actinobacteria bacterium]|nr:thiamine phosphate synthase [Actinomycetota bacterium]